MRSKAGWRKITSAGSDVGPLFQAIMLNQFARLRNGDRFFYLNENFNRSELSLFEQGNTLAKVIEANTHVTNLQSDVFLFRASVSGWVSSGQSTAGPMDFAARETSAAGITVELLDSSGDVLATTQTNRQGYYWFDQLSGPSTDPTVARVSARRGIIRSLWFCPPECTI